VLPVKKRVPGIKLFFGDWVVVWKRRKEGRRCRCIFRATATLWHNRSGGDWKLSIRNEQKTMGCLVCLLGWVSYCPGDGAYSGTHQGTAVLDWCERTVALSCCASFGCWCGSHNTFFWMLIVPVFNFAIQFFVIWEQMGALFTHHSRRLTKIAGHSFFVPPIPRIDSVIIPIKSTSSWYQTVLASLS